MAGLQYQWRDLTPEQRDELLNWRKERGNPWHSPPHRAYAGHAHYHVSAACFEHRPHIGLSPQRMEAFCRDLLSMLDKHATQTFAWCVLPNHYHALIEVPDVLVLLRELGRLHGRTSHAWNGEEDTRGRQVFFRAAERAMRSDRHFWATMNYVHHNPVRHGYVERWTDWPWSSAEAFLQGMDPAEARRIWLEYPLRDYGAGWDDPDM